MKPGDRIVWLYFKKPSLVIGCGVQRVPGVIIRVCKRRIRLKVRLLGTEKLVTASSPKSVVANESFVREYFRGENPLEKTVMVGNDEYRIVGLCRDAKFRDLRSNSPILYFSFRQNIPGSMVFEVRSYIPPELLVPAIRKALASVDPGIPLTDVHTQTEQIARILILEKLFATFRASTKQAPTISWRIRTADPTLRGDHFEAGTGPEPP